MRIFILCALAASLAPVSCSGDSPPLLPDSGATDSDTDSDTDTDSDSDTDTDTDSDSDVDECASELDDCDENATCTDLEDGWECECNEGFEGDGQTCTPEEILQLTFWEMYWEPAGYEFHRLMIGPASSTDPSDSSWEVLADETEMHNTGAADAWAQGVIADIDDWSGQEVRIAFHYHGTNADKWYVEDICIGFAPEGGTPSTCDMAAGFDSASPPSLPTGWESQNGPGNYDFTHSWRTSTSESISPQTSAVIDNSTIGVFSNKFLVSPAITLP